MLVTEIYSIVYCWVIDSYMELWILAVMGGSEGRDGKQGVD